LLNGLLKQYSSVVPFAFLVAAMGSAIGLANTWRFPYMLGVSGGGAFVFVYIGAVLILLGVFLDML